MSGRLRTRAERTAASNWLADLPLRFLKPFLQVVFVTALAKGVSLAVPLVLGALVDRVMNLATPSTILAFGYFALAIVACEVLLSVSRLYLHTHLSHQVTAVLNRRLLNQLVALPLPFFARTPRGAVRARVEELQPINNALADTSLVLVVELAFIALFFVVMYMLSPMLTGIVVACMVVAFVVSMVIVAFVRRADFHAFGAFEFYETLLLDLLGSIDSIKTLGLSEAYSERTQRAYGRFLDRRFATEFPEGLVDVTAMTYARVTSALVIVFGGLQVVEGTLTIGQIVSFHLLAGLVVQPLDRAVGALAQIAQAIISYRFVDELFEEPRERLGGAEHALTGHLEARDLAFTYPGATRPTLTDVNLSLAPGDRVLVRGTTGSGKSTLARLLGGLLSPDAGVVLADGVPVSEFATDAYRRQIAHVTQDSRLFSGTVLENLRLGRPDADLATIAAVAEQVEAQSFVLALEHGYETEIGEGGANLSGGQRQRLLLARELLRETPIVLLDEATSAIDKATRQRILGNVLAATAERLLVIVSHEESEVVDHCNVLVDVDGATVRVERRD